MLRELGARGATARYSSASRRTRASAGSSGRAAKLDAKSVNLIVFNDVSRNDIGFDAGENEVTLISARGERRIAKASKRAIAAADAR